jgi:maltose/moltooligosaccharide transporter
LLGAPLAFLGFVFIPVAQSVLAIAVFILITNIGLAVFRAPTVAWLGDLFEPDERSKANGVINLMGGVGGLLAFFGGGILFEQVGRNAPFFGGAIASLVALVVVLAFVKEPPPDKSVIVKKESVGVLKNFRTVLTNPDKSALFVLLSILFWFMAFNALETALSSFAVFTLGISPGIAAIYAGSVTISFILFAVPAGLLGTKIGRPRPIKMGLVGMTILFLVGYFIINSAITFIIILVFAGIFWAMVNVNSLPLVFDHGEKNKMGAYTGMYYFSSQSAAILGPILGGAMVEALGSQYRWIWLFSMIFMALAYFTMTKVKAVKEAVPFVEPTSD